MVILSCVTCWSLRVPSGIPETSNSVSRMKEQELCGEALLDVSNRLVKGSEVACMHKQELLLFTHMLSLGSQFPRVFVGGST